MAAFALRQGKTYNYSILDEYVVFGLSNTGEEIGQGYRRQRSICLPFRGHSEVAMNAPR